MQGQGLRSYDILLYCSHVLGRWVYLDSSGNEVAIFFFFVLMQNEVVILDHEKKQRIVWSLAL